MDINKLLAAWNQIFRNSTRLPSQDAEAEIPEATYKNHDRPEASGNTGNGSDGDLAEPQVPENAENAENAENGTDHEVDNVAEAHEAHNNSEPGDRVSNDSRDPNKDNGIAISLQNFSRDVSGLVIEGAKVAASKVKATALQARDSVNSAVNQLKEKGVIGAAKALKDWAQEHPWETALIVVPLVATACAAITLLAIGFGPGGVAAGSAAAAIQAGIGNVVAGSLFATCTSAMMGGFGAPIIFGGTWALATVATAAAKKLWTWWNTPNERRLVRRQTGSSRTVSQSLDKAAETVIFHSAVIVAFAVYYVKSWMQARRQRPEDETSLV